MPLRHRSPGGPAVPLLAALLLAPLSCAAGCDGPRAERPASGATSRRGKAPPPVAPPRVPRGEEVTFPATDGLVIHATLWQGARPDVPAIVLVHQLSRDRTEWRPLVARLLAPTALTVLALDLRGHGASTRRPDGGEIDWRSMTPADWVGVERDVAGALRFLESGAGRSLRPARLAIAGSSIGSSAAIRAAASDPRVAGVAALSPGRAYRGVDAISPLRTWGTRKLWVLATTRDRASAEATHDMLRVVRGSVGRLVEGEAHGLDMAGPVPGLYAELTAFLRETVDAP